MGLKLGQKLNFRPFLGFCSVFGRDQVFWSRHNLLAATKFSSRDTISWSRLIFWTATGFSSLTCRGHNFFVLTRIWVCEYSLESSLNVECSHEEFEPFDVPDGTEKFIFPVARYETLG